MNFRWPTDTGLELTHAEPGGNENIAHNLGDLAATVATVVHLEGDLGEVLDELLSAISTHLVADYAHDHPMRFATLQLRGVMTALVEEGARYGVALAHTAQHNAEGWQAWADAAWSLRRRSGCGEDVHTVSLVSELRALEERLTAASAAPAGEGAP